MTPYSRQVFLLDLCTYAYQLHAQTLIWPLDPYYEQVLAMTKGTHKRRRMRTATRAFFDGKVNYRGPANCRSWPIANDTLDPIIGDYTRIDPWLPAFTRPSAYAEKWLLYCVPPCISATIGKAFMVEYYARPYNSAAEFPVYSKQLDPLIGKTHFNQIMHTRPAFANGLPNRDVLACFEGGTGALPGTNPSWSMMGYVLARWDDEAKEYDAFVVFRGSRSGVLRPKQSYMHLTGNADWVTDMSSVELASDPVVSQRGDTAAGFNLTMRTMLPTIVTACQTITDEMKGKTPRRIYVTGHSLGAGLAVHFSSAMTLGSFATTTGVKTLGWDWGNLILHTYSSPVVGDATFAANFNARVLCRRIRLSGDAVTKELVPFSHHVGWDYNIPWHGRFEVSEAHEPINIRRELIGLLARTNVLNSGEVDKLLNGPFRAPWYRFDNWFELAAQLGPLVDPTAALPPGALAQRLLEPYAREVGTYFELLAGTMTLGQAMRGELNTFIDLLKYLAAAPTAKGARDVLHGMVVAGELGERTVNEVRSNAPLLFNFCVLAYYLVGVAKGLPNDINQDVQLNELLKKI